MMILAGLPISVMSFSQKTAADKIPAPVKSSFTKMFPNATVVKYEKEKKDYEVLFRDMGVEKSANFDATGKWLETETSLKPEDLPKAVADSVERNFPGYTIAGASKIDKPGNESVYEMDLKKDKNGIEVEYSEKGNILKKVPWKEDKD